jgi:hypothetical protein
MILSSFETLPMALPIDPAFLVPTPNGTLPTAVHMTPIAMPANKEFLMASRAGTTSKYLAAS